MVCVGLKQEHTNNTQSYTYSMDFSQISITIYQIHCPGIHWAEAGVQVTCESDIQWYRSKSCVFGKETPFHTITSSLGSPAT